MNSRGTGKQQSPELPVLAARDAAQVVPGAGHSGSRPVSPFQQSSLGNGILVTCWQRALFDTGVVTGSVKVSLALLGTS